MSTTSKRPVHTTRYTLIVNSGQTYARQAEAPYEIIEGEDKAYVIKKLLAKHESDKYRKRRNQIIVCHHDAVRPVKN